jgi:hypothetical protein
LIRGVRGAAGVNIAASRSFSVCVVATRVVAASVVAAFIVTTGALTVCAAACVAAGWLAAICVVVATTGADAFCPPRPAHPTIIQPATNTRTLNPSLFFTIMQSPHSSKIRVAVAPQGHSSAHDAIFPIPYRPFTINSVRF